MKENHRRFILAAVSIAAISILAFLGANPGHAGERVSGYEVLAPITEGNLTVFPVVASHDRSHDTSAYLTLDDGIRSGNVVVTETGRIAPLLRRRPRTPLVPIPLPPQGGGAQVNQLVLVNNSDQPLILLAGEIVTGGKQDRVVGKDRIVPPKSDPISLDVFCVEPGRWVERAANFKSMSSQMAQPSVRQRAMAAKSQQQVWDEVGKSAQAMRGAVAGAAAPAPPPTSSYAGVMESRAVREHVDAVAMPVERSYTSLIHELRARSAVGVVVAVNGEIIWADLFASTALLEKYWPKLIRSYAAEATTARAVDEKLDRPTVKSAQAFLEDLRGRHESVESEPGVYRNTEIQADDFTVFVLTTLLPSSGFDLHVAKMAG